MFKVILKVESQNLKLKNVSLDSTDEAGVWLLQGNAYIKALLAKFC